MPPRLRTAGGGRGNTPDLSGAMDATRSLTDAMASPSGARDADATSEIEGPPGTGREQLNGTTPPPPYAESEASTTHQPVERYVRADGKIGVIISHGHYGAWSTRIRLLFDPRDPATPGKTRRLEEVAVFDKEVVAIVLEGHIDQAKRFAMAKMGLPIQHQKTFDHVQLSVVWVAPGDEFEVAASPGFERIRVKNLIDWWRA